MFATRHDNCHITLALNGAANSFSNDTQAKAAIAYNILMLSP
jgi:hypothetical protein